MLSAASSNKIRSAMITSLITQSGAQAPPVRETVVQCPYKHHYINDYQPDVDTPMTRLDVTIAILFGLLMMGQCFILL